MSFGFEAKLLLKPFGFEARLVEWDFSDSFFCTCVQASDEVSFSISIYIQDSKPSFKRFGFEARLLLKQFLFEAKTKLDLTK